MSVGGLLEQESSFQKLRSLRTCPRIFGEVECNLSDLSHSIKEVEIVKEKTSIHCIIDTSMLSLLSCISYKQVYWSRRRESALATLCAKAQKKKKEREIL